MPIGSGEQRGRVAKSLLGEASREEKAAFLQGAQEELALRRR